MSQVTGLLRVMVNHDADELVLRLGSPPSFTRSGLPVKLFMRPMGPDRHGQLVKELLDDEQRLQLAGQGELSYEREDEIGRVLVEVKNPSSPRIRLTRLRGTAEPEPDPEPTSSEPIAAPEPLRPIVVTEPEPASERPVLPAIGGPQEVPSSLRALLDHAAERGASDLHLATGEPAVLRIDGRLLQLGDAVPDVDGMLADLLDPEGRARLASGGSVDRALALPSGHRFRLAAYRCDQGLAVALRVLRRGAPELGSLLLPPSIDELVGFSHG
ncbi:MAG: hypothetical protein KC621_02970, partial [Myxococcales bacterium]|nr:hypothetical protein [Myxococcales bacterium]